MRTEKEIRSWIDKLNYQIKELESQLNRHSSVEQEKSIYNQISDKQIEILHYQRCLGEA